MALDYLMYDADNHFYEATDAFTRHLPVERRRDFYWFSDDRGHRHIVIDGRVWDFIPNPTFDPVAVAGALDRRNVEPLSTRPEYQDRSARLARFDQQGIEASLLFPTMASGLEETVGANLPLLSDLLWAFNRWMHEDWGFSHARRIYATPLLSLSEPDQAVSMLDWVIERDCRAIMLCSGPVLTATGRVSPADPRFDPFWARCEDAGVLVCAHISATGYNRYSGDLTGHYRFRPFQNLSLDSLLNHGRAISDFFAVMAWQGALSRFPGLRLLSVENRSDWAPRLLQLFEHYYKPGLLAEDPIEAFQRCVWITPHWGDAIDELLGSVSAQHIVAGSDFPHYDTLAEPTDFVDCLKGFDDGVQRLIMRENLRSLLTTP